MDCAHVKDVGLFLILVDSFSRWPEVIKVVDRKVTTIKQILRTIFSKNRAPKTLVLDNAPKFCDENLCSWLKHIGCVTYKTPHYHPQSNGITERMVQILKIGLRTFSPFNENIKTYQDYC